MDATQAILSALADILDDEDAVRAKDAILAAFSAAGLKVVAREPTRLMIDTAEQGDDWRSYDEIWAAMLDAAP